MPAGTTEPLGGLSPTQLQQVREAVGTIVTCGLGEYTGHELNQQLVSGGGGQVPPQPDEASLEPRNQKSETGQAIPSGTILAIGGFGVEAEALCFDFQRGSWELLAAQPCQPRWGHAAAALAGALYVVGGHASGRALEVAERYEPGTGQWRRLPGMPTARRYLAAAAANGRVFALGGCNFQDVLSVVESFDPASGVWATEPPLPTARRGLAAAALGDSGSVYALGGLAGDGGRLAACTAAECLESGAHAWRTLESLRAARYGLAAAGLAGRVYAVGGWDGALGVSGAVEVFDPEVGSWSALLELSTRPAGLAVVAAAGGLYLVGGVDPGGQPLASVQRYSPEECTWAQLPDLPTGRYNLAAAVL